LHLTNDGQLVNKELKLRIHTKPRLDKQTNDQIKKIIGTQSQKIRPGYKRKIKQQIFRIKQKKRHEFIEKKIKERLLMENIKRTKKLRHKHKV
jgi:ATP-dependent RNA helicase CshB